MQIYKNTSNKDLIQIINATCRSNKCNRLYIAKLNKNKELLHEIIYRTVFLDETASLTERVYCIEHNIKERVLCKHCKKNYVRFVRNCSQPNYRTYCSMKCINNDDNVKKNKEKSYLKKYGVDNPSKAIEIKLKKEKTCFKNYGVKYPAQNKEIIKRQEQTCIKKYGYKNISCVPDVKTKKQKHMQQLFNDPEIKKNILEQRTKTLKKKYGITCGFALAKHKQISKTINERLYKILDDNHIKYEKEFIIEFANKYNKHFYRMYDIKIGNILIEGNGDYWHANPIKYKANDILIIPDIGKKYAKEIWEYDKEKEILANKNGYIVKYIWESDINKMSDSEIFNKILKFISADPQLSA